MPHLLLLHLLALLACAPKTDTGVPADTAADTDGDGAPDATDCAPDDATISPGALEVCDDLDNDCDGQIDEDLLGEWFTDVDADGYGDPTDPVEACTQPANTTADNNDCAPDDATISPGALEVCDGLDNDCDDQIDEDTQGEWFTDADMDGYGDPADPVLACTQPPDTTTDSTDCAPDDPDISPGALEICGDDLDNDCDAQIDEVHCGPTGDVDLATADLTLLGPSGAGLSRGAPAGDLDGDGLLDLWVGGPDHDGLGGIWAVSGEWTGERELDALATCAGVVPSSRTGATLAGGVDLDDDGLPELVVGAPGSGETGVIYVLGGKIPPTVDGALGSITNGDGHHYGLGAYLSTSSDLTGDGVGDLVVGSLGSWEDSYTGAAWLLPGPVLGRRTLEGALRFPGVTSGDYAGYGVAGVGDTNGDGHPDLLVGAWGADSYGYDTGVAGLFYGPLTEGRVLDEADRVFVGTAEYEQFSRGAVTGRGDLDGDGLDDLLIGAPFHSGGALYGGGAFVFLGDPSATGETGAALAWLRIAGETPSGYLGGVEDLLDKDGDGFADVVVGASSGGTAWLFYGPDGGSRTDSEADARFEAEGDLTVGHLGDPGGRQDLLLGGSGFGEGGAVWIWR